MSNEMFVELDRLIAANDKEGVINKLREIKLAIDSGDVYAIEYVATPANLTRLHNDLCEKMQVFRKMLQLRGRVPNARHRASLFIQAMINAVGHLK